MNDILKQILDEMKQMNHRIEHLEEGVTTNTTVIQEMKSDMRTMSTDVSTTKSDMQTMNTDISTMKSDMQTMNTDISTMKSDMQTMNTDISTMKSDMQTMNTDISTMKLDFLNHFGILETKFTGLETEVTEIKKIVQRIEENQPGDVYAMLQTINNKLDKRDADIQVLNKRVFLVESAVERLSRS